MLTKMQKRYIWLAGSFPHLAIVQGRGHRSPRTMYNVSEEAGELTVFGYSDPLYFLVGRGLFRKMQAPHSYTLTEAGEAEFQNMLARGDGGTINEEIKEVRLRETLTPPHGYFPGFVEPDRRQQGKET